MKAIVLLLAVLGVVTATALLLRDDRTDAPSAAPDATPRAEEWRPGVSGVSTGWVNAAERAVGLTRVYSTSPPPGIDRRGGYRTVSRTLRYAPCTLEQLVVGAYNLELNGRLRVHELSWRLADPRENGTPPHHRVQGAVIRVGFREPVFSDGSSR